VALLPGRKDVAGNFTRKVMRLINISMDGSPPSGMITITTIARQLETDSYPDKLILDFN
jgi:hypothetical protein